MRFAVHPLWPPIWTWNMKRQHLQYVDHLIIFIVDHCGMWVLGVNQQTSPQLIKSSAPSRKDRNAFEEIGSASVPWLQLIHCRILQILAASVIHNDSQWFTTLRSKRTSSITSQPGDIKMWSNLAKRINKASNDAFSLLFTSIYNEIQWAHKTVGNEAGQATCLQLTSKWSTMNYSTPHACPWNTDSNTSSLFGSSCPRHTL